MKTSPTQWLMLAFMLIIVLVVMTSCGGSGGSSATSFTVGGTITGLGNDTGLVLANGTDTLTVQANATSFTMPTPVANGQSYDITVKAHPIALQCNIIDAAGSVDGANVSAISVSCEPGTESVLYSFAGAPTDGEGPLGLFQALDGSFIGLTAEGGTDAYPNGPVYGGGTVFDFTPSSDSETVLYSFPSNATDGSNPDDIIQASDGNFYGVTGSGGDTLGDGVIFKLTPGGTETILHTFTGGTADGADPVSILQAKDGSFYGVTENGGANNAGIVFKLTPDGTETVLYSFASGMSSASLIQGSDGNFYGTTQYGGIITQCNPTEDTYSASGNGIVFKLTLNGTETVLHTFDGGTSDGCQPFGLIQGADGNFYGVTAGGGVNNYGVVFKITPSGAETILYSFSGGVTDGAFPLAIIQTNDGNFYGITHAGGILAGNTCGYVYGNGVLFKLTPTGTETVLHSFACGPTDGYEPSGLIQTSDGDLLGTTGGGGTNNDGTIFDFN